MLADYFSMKNWGSSSFSDYSELHRDCFVACYSYPRTKPTPWWVQMGSRLGIQNFDVNHCNTHKLTKDMSSLSGLIVGYSTSAESTSFEITSMSWISSTFLGEGSLSLGHKLLEDISSNSS